MSRYSTRYDASSPYKSLDSSNLGSYRSSNLSAYSGLGHSSSRSDRWGSSSYSPSPSSSSSSTSRLHHGSYSSSSRTSSAIDSMSLPRSSSFRREVLSSSTPREPADKGGYAVSSRSSALSSSHSLDSKEPRLERPSSQRRDSDPDSGQLSRRWAGRRRRSRESSLTEESEGKESSPDVLDAGVRRARSLRGASGSSEDSSPAPSLAAASSVDAEDSAFQRSSEARRSRRQQRLEEASRQQSGSQEEGAGREPETSSASSATTRPWRRRLQEQGITSDSPSDDTKTTRRRSRDDPDSIVASSRRRGTVGEASAEEAAKMADAVASDVETRAERIARYKEERRKQLAHIASITAPDGAKSMEALPSLFTAAKREKEGSPSDSAGQTASEAEEMNGGGLSLSSRLRALRSGSEEKVRDSDSADGLRAQNSAPARPEVPEERETGVKTRSAERDSSRRSPDQAPSAVKDKTAQARKSPSSASTRKPLTTSTESTVTRRTSTSSREPSPKKTPVSSVSDDKPVRRTSDSSTDARAGRKPSDSAVDSRAGRKPSDSSFESRKSKSPSPVSSRLLAATKSSAARGAVTAGRGSPSPRSTPSPRSSPGPSDRSSVSKSATSASSSRGPPKIKQSLMPERGAKDTAAPAAGIEESREEQAGSKYMVRLPLSQSTEKTSGRPPSRESPQRTGASAAPRLSSSSFSAASSTPSTDRDSGFGSSRLSSSSFSSTRSTDRDTSDLHKTTTSKPPRLQRTAHIEVSSSSSREGSEEKQLAGTRASSSPIKRTSSLPSRPMSSASQPGKASESSRTPAGERKLSSSFRDKEPTPPRDSPLSQRLGARRASSKEDEVFKTAADRKDSVSKAGSVPGETAPSSPGAAGLDDILAKNAEFLSSDEETGSGKSKREQRQLRTGEEPRPRRSLRKRLLHKSGSSSGSSRDSPARESKEKEAESDNTVTLPTTTSTTVPTPTPTTHPDVEKAPSTPAVGAQPRQRPEDKSEVRKSALNKAVDSSNRGADQGNGARDEEPRQTFSSSSSSRAAQLGIGLTNKVSDMRSRFNGGQSDKSKAEKPGGITRRTSRGKDFSELLQKFSDPEASSSERSGSDSSRRTPERTHSLKVERSGSFKSDFMTKRFSPVPKDDKPTAELSAVLSRRQQEVKRQQDEEESEPDQRGDRRQAKAHHFKASSVDEVIADNEVAAVLRARRKETDSKVEAAPDQPGFKTIEESLDTLPRVTHELHEVKEPSPETERLKPVPRSQAGSDSGRATSKKSIKEAEQVISDVQTRITSSLHHSSKDKAKTVSAKDKETSHTTDVQTRATSSLQHSDKDTAKAVSARKDNAEVLSSKEKRPSTSASTASKELSNRAERAGSKDSDKDASHTTSTFTITSTPTFSPLRSPERESSVESSTSSGSGLRRAESLKEQTSVTRSGSFERPKGILKRTPSASNQERPIIDPQLARIMEQRRQREQEMEAADEEEEGEEEAAKRGLGRPRALSAAEEIEENVRRMRENHSGDTEHQKEEAVLCMSVSERINLMQTKAQQSSLDTHVPKSRSGTTTPRLLGSGHTTPRKQMSVDEGVAEVIPEETTTTMEEGLSSTQLIERLSTVWAKNQSFDDRRQKFQKRQRDDWRTRTQPVTLEEIKQADGLESVSAFRAEVRRKASQNIFDQLKNQDSSKTARPLPPTKDLEFPQHLTPEKRTGGGTRRSRLQRHKTLPVTAEELNAIPEGELVETVQMRDTNDMWKRDSRTDSGILCGSDVESLGSDSLRSLSLDMDLSDSDPSRLSVSTKASIFRQLDEKAKVEREKEKCASGAKRYIDRKKRERWRTQPVTDDEVKTAARMSDADSKKTAQVRGPQPEVVNRPKSPSGEGEAPQEEEEEEDQLTKLTLAEKVKLFSRKQAEELEAASNKPPPRSEAPPPRRLRRKEASRFQTQPVTTEELEQASKITPLMMSLVKPPEPELLSGLRVKDQQDLMRRHAESTLAKCSNRASSRPSSQPGSRRGSFTTPDTLQSGDGAEESSASSAATSTTTTTTTSSSKGSRQTTGSDTEPRGILKKTKSTESVPSDQTVPKPIPTTTTTTRDESSTTTTTKNLESVKDSKIVNGSSMRDSNGQEDTEGDRASPVAELILPVVEAEVDVSSTTFFLADSDIGGESTTDPVQTDEGEGGGDATTAPGRTAAATPDSKRRSRFTDRKAQAERYLTQPPVQIPASESPKPRKYEGRHLTQPITPSEMKEAESATTPSSMVPGGSISERLNQLKTQGEESWKRRVQKDPDTPLSSIQLRDKKGLAAVRPSSISDRLSSLEVSAKQWIGRVEETDAKSFTVASKLSSKTNAGYGSESPLVAKIKASSKKDLTKLEDSSNASSPVMSPSTPTKEFLPKVPLPKEIVADPVAVKKAEEEAKSKKETQEGQDASPEEAPVRVEVPKLDEKEIEEFFSIKEITEITDKVDVDVDDFNNIFVEANEILQSVKKIRPTRKKKATSRNPLKTVSQFVEIQTEYTQISTGAAEKQLRQMKTDALKRESGLAVEALAALSSKENFSNVPLRKTEQSSLPPALASQQNPFSDLMLLHIKGRRTVQTRLVEPSSKSLNAGDCYLLVTPDRVISWIGDGANIIEKAKVSEVATYISQKRDMGYKGTGAAQSVDQAKDHLGAGKQFWAAISGERQCQACGPDEEDELYETAIIKTNMVYKLTDGALRPLEEYWGTTPRYEMLARTEVFVFDFGPELYVWLGTSVSRAKRKLAVSLAQKMFDSGYDYSECAVNPMGPLRGDDDDMPPKASKRPDWAIFGKVNQNMETILFREKFADWPDTSRLIGVKERKVPEQKVEFADIKAFDAKKMVPVNNAPVTLKLDGAHVGRGKKWEEDMQGFTKETLILTLGKKIWHVMEYDHYEVPETSNGQFHQGDTYVVRWQYMMTNAGLRSLKGAAARQSLTGRERCAYFFWQGKDSTVNEKGASALMTVELDEERGPQVRVVQGKEPPCFLNLFEGSMMVHIGKREDPSTNTVGPWRMFAVRGDEASEVCLLEIPISIRHLRSRSSLVLLNTRTGITYIWHGVKSPKHVRELAASAVKTLKEKRPLELDLHQDAHIVVTEVEEGQEKSEIWSALDSRDRSLYHSLLRDPAQYTATPRLFEMSSVSMVFEVTEHLNPARLPGVTNPFPFFQTDLYNATQPALFLMDVGKKVYLWQGWWPFGDEDVENVHTGSATARFNIDRRCAMETTLNYCKEQGSEAFLVHAGVEPLEFQNFFPFWEPNATVRSLALQEGKQDGWCEPVEDVYTRLTQARYTFEELQDRPLPDGVDPLKLETYLVDEEFEEVLEMNREEFYQLPQWKQKQVKQQVGLY